MTKQEIENELKKLKNESNYLYDLFVRASPSRSGAILSKLCEIDKQMHDLKNQLKSFK